MNCQINIFRHMKLLYHLRFFSFLLVMVLGFIICVFVVSCQQNSSKEDKETIISKDSVLCSKNNGKMYSEQYVINSSGDTVLFSSIMENDICYIRYSNYSCVECVDFIVKNLCNVMTTNIIFLLADVPVTDLHVFETAMPYAKYYKVESFFCDFDAAATPYIFQTSNGKICNFFIPRRELPESYKLYLKSINK